MAHKNPHHSGAAGSNSKRNFWPLGSKRKNNSSAAYAESSLTPYTHPDRSADSNSSAFQTAQSPTTQAAAPEHTPAPYFSNSSTHSPMPAPPQEDIENVWGSHGHRRR